jgi:hypothetical protein
MQNAFEQKTIFSKCILEKKYREEGKLEASRDEL